MSKTHCITFTPSSPLVMIRADFLRICDNNHCAAAALNQMMYWHEVKLAQAAQAEQTNQQLMAAGKKPTQRTDCWVWKSANEMHGELLGTWGKNAVRDAFKMLLDKGYLLERRNPENDWDRTKQYLFQVQVVQHAVNAAPTADALKVTPGDVNFNASSNSDCSMSRNGHVDVLNLTNGDADSGTSKARNQHVIIKTTSSNYLGEYIQKTTTTDPKPAQEEVAVEDRDVVVAPFDKSVDSEQKDTLLDELTAIGVTEQVAIRLINVNRLECEKQLALLPRRKAADPAAVLVRAIKECWAAPAEPAPAPNPKQRQYVQATHQRIDRFGDKPRLFDQPAPRPKPEPSPIPPELAAAWEVALENLEKQSVINKPTFETHIRTCRPIALCGTIVTLEVNTEFSVNWLQRCLRVCGGSLAGAIACALSGALGLPADALQAQVRLNPHAAQKEQT